MNLHCPLALFTFSPRMAQQNSQTTEELAQQEHNGASRHDTNRAAQRPPPSTDDASSVTQSAADGATPSPVARLRRSFSNALRRFSPMKREKFSSMSPSSNDEDQGREETLSPSPAPPCTLPPLNIDLEAEISPTPTEDVPVPEIHHLTKDRPKASPRRRSASLKLIKQSSQKDQLVATIFNDYKGIDGLVDDLDLSYRGLSPADLTVAVETIHEAAKNIGECEALTIRGNPLAHIPPPVLRALPKLRRLEASGCEMQCLSPAVCDLSRLVLLTLNDNTLSTLPPEISSLSSLKRLLVSHNQLTHLPEELCDLPHLESMFLNGNRLTSLPSRIGNLKKLKNLDVGDNCLNALPPSIGQCASLEIFYAFQNNLTHLPFEIGNLRSLSRLSVSCNAIESLPDCWGSLPSLREFFATGNALRSLPDSFSKLRLYELHLEQNEFTSKPKLLSPMKSLRIFNIDLADTQQAYPRGTRLHATPPQPHPAPSAKSPSSNNVQQDNLSSSPSRASPSHSLHSSPPPKSSASRGPSGAPISPLRPDPTPSSGGHTAARSVSPSYQSPPRRRISSPFLENSDGEGKKEERVLKSPPPRKKVISHFGSQTNGDDSNDRNRRSSTEREELERVRSFSRPVSSLAKTFTQGDAPQTPPQRQRPTRNRENSKLSSQIDRFESAGE